MVFTWKIFIDLVEKEITILISGERHEIAKRLRILASHAPTDAELVNDLLGLYPGEYIDGYDPCNVQHLADLIEPKERTCQMKKKEPGYILSGWWECDKCGIVYPPCKEEIALWALQYCPHCGAKVVE